MYVGGRPLPIAFDFEPYVPANRVPAQGAMMELHSRAESRWPELPLHLVVDSAFGSFDRLDEIVASGGDATMSMSSNVTPWLWALLGYECGIDAGRVAYIPSTQVLVGSYQVQTEKKEVHQLKIISSACKVEDIPDEVVVVQVSDSRLVRDKDAKKIEFLAHYTDGSSEWLKPKDLIGDDGNVDYALLSFASEEDLKQAFNSFTKQQLQVLSFRLHSS